eukprot:CAMPEP_0168580150 /NCGR_PEP_ID=MMETSP0420-20121227/633_1 /TAXON_ID=498008 /ORGANISM="Pessonella sp." /LENGTH=87 /DNA_ID=CAMNT_0008614227 /DNA_START=340 /DNA_END=601 /DNA_ORIENTATION=+
MSLDINLDGQFDITGDDCVQAGLEKIDKYFFQEGLYWGKDYYIEESRHWEISEQKAQEWLKPPPAPTTNAVCGNGQIEPGEQCDDTG